MRAAKLPNGITLPNDQLDVLAHSIKWKRKRKSKHWLKVTVNWIPLEDGELHEIGYDYGSRTDYEKLNIFF